MVVKGVLELELARENLYGVYVIGIVSTVKLFDFYFLADSTFSCCNSRFVILAVEQSSMLIWLFDSQVESS